MKRELFEIMTWGPETFDEACVVHHEYIDAVQRVLSSYSHLELMRALDDVRKWEKLLPMALALRNIEVKRRMYEVPSMTFPISDFAQRCSELNKESCK